MASWLNIKFSFKFCLCLKASVCPSQLSIDKLIWETFSKKFATITLKLCVCLCVRRCFNTACSIYIAVFVYTHLLCVISIFMDNPRANTQRNSTTCHERKRPESSSRWFIIKRLRFQNWGFQCNLTLGIIAFACFDVLHECDLV